MDNRIAVKNSRIVAKVASSIAKPLREEIDAIQIAKNAIRPRNQRKEKFIDQPVAIGEVEDMPSYPVLDRSAPRCAQRT